MIKKTFFILCSVIIAFSALAENPLHLKSGSLRELKRCGKSISCHFDFSGTRANRKSLNEYLVNDYQSSRKEFDNNVPTMIKWFSDRWDDDIDDGPRYTSNPNAPYHMEVVIRTLQLGTKSRFGGSSISGYVYFYYNGDEIPFAEVEILKLEGTQFKVPLPGYEGLYQVFNDLAEYLCDLIFKS